MISDLTNVKEDVENVIAGAQNFGASLEDIIVLENPKVAQVSDLILSVQNMIYENNRFGDSTHVHLNYLGHSVMKMGSFFAIFNDDCEIFMCPLEGMLQKISMTAGAYITAVFNHSQL